MKKIAAFLMGMLMVSFVSAQEEPLPEDWEIAVESEEMARKAMDATLIDADSKLDSRVKKLESGLKIGGYLAVAGEWNVDAMQVGHYDASPENTRFRLNFSYSDGPATLAARMQFRPLNQNSGDTMNFVDLAYFYGAFKFTDFVKVTAGRVRTGDYATRFFAGRDSFGAGYIDGQNGIEIQAVLPKSMNLPLGMEAKLGLFYPIDGDNISRTMGTGGAQDAWTTSGEETDINLAVNTDLFKFRTGFLGGDRFYRTGRTGLSFNEPLTIQDTNNVNTFYSSLTLDQKLLMVPGLQLALLHSQAYNRADAANYMVGMNASIEYKAGDFRIGVDYSWMAPSQEAFPGKTEYYNHLFVSADYTLKDLLGKDFSLVPELEVRWDSAPDAANQRDRSRLALSPELNFRAAKSEFRIGLDYYMSLVEGGSYLDAINGDTSITKVTTGFAINF